MIIAGQLIFYSTNTWFGTLNLSIINNIECCGFFQMWTMITDWITDFTDLENLSNSSPFFRNVLLNRRTEFLGLEALRLLVTKKHLTTVKWLDAPSCFDQRQVCKSWSMGVDKSFEEHGNSCLKFSSKFGKKQRSLSVPLYLLFDRQVSTWFLHQFMESHGNTNRNPFLGRTIRASTREASGQFLKILRLFGHHLRCLKLDDETPVNVRILHRYLEAMPNLCRLQIYDWTSYNKNSAIKSLPILPNLLTLKATLKFATQSGILSSNLTIRHLQLSVHLLPSAAELRSLSFPNVQDLKLVLHLRLGLIFLGKMDVNTPSLSNLIIHWDDFEQFQQLTIKQSFLHWPKFFEFINKNWSKNAALLKQVELELPGFTSLIRTCRTLCNGSSYRLNLRKVEQVKLLLGSPCCLDMLLPMRKNLKYLRVKIQCQSFTVDKYLGLGKSLEYAMKCQRIEFIGFEKRLEESNIWSLFPKLQKVVIEGNLSYANKAYYSSNGGEREYACYNRRDSKLE